MDNTETLTAVKAALAANDVAAAVRLATTAVAAGAEDSLLFNLAAYGLQLERRFAESMVLLERALRANPNDPLIHNAIGQLLSQQGKLSESAQAFERALAINPSVAAAHRGLGQAYTMIGDLERARQHLEQAVRYAPNDAEALGELSKLVWQTKDTVEARRLAERAVALDPLQPAGATCLAGLDLEAGDADAAEARLRALLSNRELAPLQEAAAEVQLGNVLDARGAAAEAFEHYTAGQALFRTVHVPRFADVPSGIDVTRRLRAYFVTASADSWRVPAGQGPDPAGGPLRHVFMVGFFRSGTTLLEQVLASHGDICSLEEKPILELAAREFFTDNENLDRLANLTDAQRENLRADYHRQVRSNGVEPAGKVFVDKLPMGSLWAPFIAKVFPEARILFARRDPRDVVLSCFRHQFHATPISLELTSLTRAAQFYGGLMDLFEAYERLLGLPVLVCRHEDLIGDFDGETQRICAFLDVPWRERMRDFVATARRRDIRTPSAGQVVRGLNAAGVGRWRAYADEMSEALEILAPWVEKFGYPPA